MKCHIKNLTRNEYLKRVDNPKEICSDFISQHFESWTSNVREAGLYEKRDAKYVRGILLDHIVLKGTNIERMYEIELEKA